MKIKDCEKLTGTYKHNCHNVQIGIDDTDHVVFLCDKCKSPLEVIEVFSKNIPVTMDCKTKENCTWIYVVCHNCKTLGKRKFYWKEDGKFCWNRTQTQTKSQEVTK